MPCLLREQMLADVLCGGLLYPRAVCPSLSLVLSPRTTPLRVGGGFPSYTCCMLGLRLAGSRDSGRESYVTAQAARRGIAHIRVRAWMLVRAWVLVRPHTLSALYVYALLATACAAYTRGWRAAAGTGD